MAHIECSKISHHGHEITIWRRFPVDRTPENPNGHDYWPQIVAPDGTAIVDTPWHGAEQPPTYLGEYAAEKAAKSLIDELLGKSARKKKGMSKKTQQAIRELSAEVLALYPDLSDRDLDEAMAVLIASNINDELVDRLREILEEGEEVAA